MDKVQREFFESLRALFHISAIAIENNDNFIRVRCNCSSDGLEAVEQLLMSVIGHNDDAKFHIVRLCKEGEDVICKLAKNVIREDNFYTVQSVLKGSHATVS